MTQLKIPGLRKKTAKGTVYWYFDTKQKKPNGQPKLVPLGQSSDPDFGRKLARAQAARTMRTPKRSDVVTVSALADMWEKSVEWRKLADGSRRNYGTYVKVIREQIGIAPANEVKQSDVLVLRDKMAEKPAASNMAVRTLGSLYSWGRKHEHVTINPVQNVELLEEGEHEPWPEWLLEKALADEAVRLPVALLYYTAQRSGDVCRMRWSDINGNAVQVKQQKTGKSLQIPLHRDLAALLAKAPRKGLTVLLREDGKPWTVRSLRGLFQAWAAEHGQEVVTHGLRKNAVIALLEAGCSFAETAAISGQSLQMVEHYARLRNQVALGSAAILKWEAKK